jgi:hypothetical protein
LNPLSLGANRKKRLFEMWRELVLRENVELGQKFPAGVILIHLISTQLGCIDDADRRVLT